MADRLGVIRRALMLPADDLSLEFLRGGYYGLGDDFALTLSLLYGIGPNAPRLITVDDTGKLLLGTSGLIGGAFLMDNPANGSSIVRVVTSNDAAGLVQPSLLTVASAYGFNGAASDRLRLASAANLAAQSGQGVLETSPPGMWSVVSTPAAGVVASAVRAAGAAGVRHVCTGIIVTLGAIVAPVATALTWNLRDGASGAGAILASGQIAVPAAVFQGAPLVLSDIAIPGTAATAMTLEFSGALANLLEGVTLLGFDAS